MADFSIYREKDFLSCKNFDKTVMNYLRKHNSYAINNTLSKEFDTQDF
ncbi:hypothetical protein [Candidatus Walczuchella monophlebidarum]|nr:hypothetical protein [Candidatus Walczuchella monophlebidarum]